MSPVVVILHCCLFMITIETVVTRLSINFSDFKDLVDFQPILIDGKRTYVSDWYSQINNKIDDSDNEHLAISFTFIKCKCTDYIKTLIKIVYYLLNFCPPVESDESTYHAVEKCLNGINYFLKLDESISRAMTTLFGIVDAYRNLKSHEQYFLKILLMTYMYIGSFKDSKHKTIVADRKYISGKYSRSCTKNSKLEFVKMRRVVLQIWNRVHWYDIEFCDAKPQQIGTYIAHKVTPRDEHLRYFDDFLGRVVVSIDDDDDDDDDSPSYSPFTMDDIKLEKCLSLLSADDGASTEYGKRYGALCLNFLQKSTVVAVRRTGKQWGFLTVRDWFETRVQHSYELDTVYEHMSAVYRVVWKLLLRETAERWKDNDPSDVEDCEATRSTLESLDFPVEFVDHFGFVCEVQNYRGTSSSGKIRAKVIAEAELKMSHLTEVNLPEIGLNDVNLSLSDFINVITTGNGFRTFWSTFNLLRKLSEKNPRSVYDLPLDLDLGDVQNPSNNTLIKCTMLTDIYFNFFVLQTMDARCSATDNRNACKQFSDMLLDFHDKRNEIPYLRDDSDLQSILLVVIDHFKNASHTRLDTKNNSKTTDVFVQNKKKLRRTEDAIMNLIDDYQIRHCKNMKNRHCVYENEYKNGEHTEIPQLKNIIIKPTKSAFNVGNYMTYSRKKSPKKSIDKQVYGNDKNRV